MSPEAQVCEADMDPEEYAALWAKRAADLVRRKKDEQRKHIALVIALVDAAGGKIRVGALAVFEAANKELLCWNDPQTNEVIYQTRTARTEEAGKS